MKIDNRQQLLIVLVAVAAALLIGNSLIYAPMARKWTARSKQIKDLSNQVKEGNVLIKREAALRGQWNNMTANALTNNTSLAENQVISALNTWSRSTGADITSIMPQWKYDSTNYWTLNCRLEASGTIATLSQFLYRIEQGPMALKLDSVELAAHEPTGQQLTLGLQVSGLALLQPQPTKQVKR
jgi:Tfp pilus assembly protein PilO